MWELSPRMPIVLRMTITIGIAAVCAIVGSVLWFATAEKISTWGLHLFTAGTVALLLGIR